jgi:sulfur carrier protein ThiS
MGIKVKVKLFGENGKEMHLSDDANNLRTLLEILSKDKRAKYIEDGCITIVNKEPIVDDIELSDGDHIDILPILQGG